MHGYSRVKLGFLKRCHASGSTLLHGLGEEHPAGSVRHDDTGADSLATSTDHGRCVATSFSSLPLGGRQSTGAPEGTYEASSPQIHDSSRKNRKTGR